MSPYLCLRCQASLAGRCATTSDEFKTQLRVVSEIPLNFVICMVWVIGERLSRDFARELLYIDSFCSQTCSKAQYFGFFSHVTR
jgi:hypothetical protein